MLLSEQELRSALEPLLDRLLVERFKYFQLQLEARLQSLIEAAAPAPATTSDPAEGGLQRLLRAKDPDEVFEFLFAAVAALPARALLVRYQGRLTVWRQQGLKLPERFAVADQSIVLRAGADTASGTYPVRVRGVIVGLLHWRAAAAPEAKELERLEAMFECAGLVLLGIALAEAAPTPSKEILAEAPGGDEQGKARAFAQLLAEDLELFLRRERAAEVSEARRLEDAWDRFQPEVERCRRGFMERHPQQGAIGEAIFRETMQRLQS